MKVDERELDRIEAIILSMTAEERRSPELINGSRRMRIASGSGTNVQAVNQLIKQFGQMQKMMKPLQQGKMPDLGAADAAGGSARRRSSVSRPNLSKGELWQYDQAHPRGRQEEPDLARRRRRPALAARRARIETIGHYNPQTEPSTIVLDEERVRALARARRAADRHGHASCSRPRASRLGARCRRAMKELLEYLARGAGRRARRRSRSSEFEEDDGTVVLELSVAEDDYGKVIGRGGRTASAAHRREGRGGQGGPPRPRRHRRLTLPASPRRAASAGRTASTAAST